MKKLLALIIILSSLTSAAKCQESTTIFLSEADDDGVEVSLSNICNNAGDDYVCVYMDESEKLAAVDGVVSGVNFYSSELYKRSVKDSKKSLSISLKNGELFDNKKIHLDLDKKTGEAEVTYTNVGWSPFGGTTNISVSMILNCK